MDYTDILVEKDGAIGAVIMNSPKTANALSKKMIGELTSAFEDFRADRSAKVVVIKTGGKHFCSGHNLKEMIDGSVTDYRAIFDDCVRMMTLIHEMPQIVIAQVHGVATAAGCQMVATCDLAVADDTARFGTPGVKIGLFCNTPMVALSRAVSRKHALEMLMTGKLVSADEAERSGLVNKVVPESELESAVAEMAHSIAEASPLTLSIGKRAFYTQIDQDEPSAYEFASGIMTLNLMTDDAQEGIKAFLDKRKPTWTGR